MAATEQTAKKLGYNQVDDLRQYIQYMILSQEVKKHDIFVPQCDDSEEEEFKLE